MVANCHFVCYTALMASVPTNPARLNFRLGPDQKATIEQAAAVLGQSVSDFAVASMLKVAHETIATAATTRLSARDARAFLRMLDAPPRANAALRTAAARYKARRG